MSMSRKELTFASGHDTCAAWFYPAAADKGPRPIIVMAHGLTGTRRDRLGSFAERFAAAGIAALVFDYRGFGDSTGEPDLFEPSLQLEDWRAAIAFARSLPDIDPGRVATFGSSLGGGNALAAAAEDPKVAAVISQVPFLDRDSQTYAKPRHVVEEMKAAAIEGRYLAAVGQPDEAALISAPGAEVGWRRVVAIGEESRWRNRVSASWLLGPPYSPIRHAASFTVLGWFASLRTIRWPSRRLQSRPRARPRKASFASIRVSIISTSTMGRPMRPWSPMRSSFFTATC